MTRLPVERHVVALQKHRHPAGNDAMTCSPKMVLARQAWPLHEKLCT